MQLAVDWPNLVGDTTALEINTVLRKCKHVDFICLYFFQTDGVLVNQESAEIAKNKRNDLCGMRPKHYWYETEKKLQK